jgi:hypothetical protein
LPITPFPALIPRNGAVLVHKKTALDLTFLRHLAESVQTAARTQGVAGEEFTEATRSTIKGRYCWRAYLHEELMEAHENLGAHA